MKVEVIAWRCLKIALLERLSMPDSIALINGHVVHVDRHPHIGRSVCYLIIYAVINNKVTRLRITILNVIHTRLSNT